MFIKVKEIYNQLQIKYLKNKIINKIEFITELSKKETLYLSTAQLKGIILSKKIAIKISAQDIIKLIQKIYLILFLIIKAFLNQSNKDSKIF